MGPKTSWGYGRRWRARSRPSFDKSGPPHHGGSAPSLPSPRLSAETRHGEQNQQSSRWPTSRAAFRLMPATIARPPTCVRPQLLRRTARPGAWPTRGKRPPVVCGAGAPAPEPRQTCAHQDRPGPTGRSTTCSRQPRSPTTPWPLGGLPAQRQKPSERHERRAHRQRDGEHQGQRRRAITACPLAAGNRGGELGAPSPTAAAAVPRCGHCCFHASLASPTITAAYSASSSLRMQSRPAIRGDGGGRGARPRQRHVQRPT